MAHHTLQSAAPGLPLTGGSYLRLEAIDPTTGAAVTGVTVEDVAVYGIDVSAAVGGLLTDEIPRYTPEEIP